MAVTIRFVIRANPQNILCVLVPNLALMTWRKVLAPGALIFSWTETIENSSIWTEAPAAYQNGPLIPYWKRSTNCLHLLHDVTLKCEQPFRTSEYFIGLHWEYQFLLFKKFFLPFFYCCSMYINQLKIIELNVSIKTPDWNPFFP